MENRNLTSTDLKSMPLIHGSLMLYENWEAIKKEGLRAAGGKTSGPNSFKIDEALGRNNYVFLTTLRKTGTFGQGDYVIVHPEVIGKDKTLGILNDPGEAGEIFSQIRYCWKNSRSLFSKMVSGIKDITLADFIREIESNIDLSVDEIEWEEQLEMKLLTSNQFHEYYQNLCLDIDLFYSELGSECRNRAYSLRDYILRESEWPYNDEILVYHNIEPDFILGRVENNKWIPTSFSDRFPDLDVYLELLGIEA
tara:strand:+ start:97 stop:852 length:756 start_codon:yes stop_codon:yes gene_type:complete